MRDEGFTELSARVDSLMRPAQADLEDLVRIPSVAFDGFPREPLDRAADAIADILLRCGLKGVRLLEIPDCPHAVFAERPPQPAHPTVLLYAHYDVQPMEQEHLWRTQPFEPSLLDGRLYGRGAADNKAGAVMHAYAVKALADDYGVGIKVLIEGDEETGRNSMAAWVRANPDALQADVVIIGDTANVRIGEPTLTVSLRGMIDMIVEVETLGSPVHSGMFGGGVPDALTATARMLDSMFDDSGSVAVDGLSDSNWNGSTYAEAHLREDARVLPGVDLTGKGTPAQRLWGQPSIAVVGLDAPSVATAANCLIPRVQAKISVRLSPRQDRDEAMQAVRRHLEAHVPWHARLRITEGVATRGFSAQTDGPGYKLLTDCLTDAFEQDVTLVGNGGSIPLLAALSEAVPDAEIMLLGAMEPMCNIHSVNESISMEELQRCMLAETLFLSRMAPRAT